MKKCLFFSISAAMSSNMLTFMINPKQYIRHKPILQSGQYVRMRDLFVFRPPSVCLVHTTQGRRAPSEMK